MKKIIVAVMLLIALMTVAKVGLHLYGIVQFVANASEAKVVADAGDYRENSPC